MKQFFILLSALLLTTSCTKTTPSPDQIKPTPVVLENIDDYADFLQYPPEFAYSYAVDKDGLVYIAESINPGSAYAENVIGVYDLSGVKLTEHTVQTHGSLSKLCVGDNALYFVSFTLSGLALYSFDFSKQETEQIITLDQFGLDKWSGIHKIAYLDGLIYILADDPAYAGKEIELWEEDAWERIGYRYDGTILAAFNIADKTIETVYDGELHNFTITPDGKIMLYAHDGIGGFYFQELDPTAGFMLGEKIYRRATNLSSFDFDGVGIIFFGSGQMNYRTTLKYWLLTDDAGVSEIMPEITFSRDILHYKGFTFVLTENGQLNRVKNSAYIKGNPAIKAISAGAFSSNVFAEGVNVEFAELDHEEFALTVLSRDRDYDICFLYSPKDISANIKNKGSFYPLNDVPGVQELLDACFPYIKEAATDQDGNIWMIPLSLDIDTITFSDQNCREAGIDFANAATVSEIIENVRKAAAYDTNGLHYRYNPYSLSYYGVIKYLRSLNTLDTPEFRRMATDLRMIWGEQGLWGSSWPDYREPGFLFIDVVPFPIHQVSEQDGLHVMPIAGSDGSPNSAKVTLLSVNPDSDNLEATLGYISAVCEYLMGLDDLLMFKDISRYPDSDYMRSLHALYANSVIDFGIPDEIFADDFDRYLRDEISLDEMIKEADRKLAMYRGE